MSRARILRLRLSATIAVTRAVLVVLAKVSREAVTAYRKAWTL